VNDHDLPLAISAVTGAGLFITTIVLAMVILFSPEDIEVKSN
jgi:Ca2+/Na+ antiporter